jgi:hypothetical protein
LHSWQKQGDQDSDNRDDDQKLDEREPWAVMFCDSCAGF